MGTIYNKKYLKTSKKKKEKLFIEHIKEALEQDKHLILVTSIQGNIIDMKTTIKNLRIEEVVQIYSNSVKKIVEEDKDTVELEDDSR